MSQTIFEKVKNGGYCIGCAACTAVQGSPIKMNFLDNGKYSAVLENNEPAEALNNAMNVCPFSGIGKNEMEIAEELYKEADGHDEYLGYYQSNYVGYVVEGDYRKEGSSGGMGTWIVSELFKKGEIDYVVHVKENNDSILFKYSVSDNLDEIQKSAKSRYYPVEMSEVLKIIKEVPGRYAVVGLPCFIKSIRLLSEQEPVFKERIKYCIGLVCGHLKSSYFAEMMAMQVGFSQENFKTINFRQKLENRNAGDYGVRIKGYDDNKLREVIKPTRDLFGTNWGHNFFKYNACDYCDDVLAETADITIGDAWLPEYINDSLGTNVIVVRNKEVDSIIKDAIDEKRLKLDALSAAKIYESQAGGFRHRREGLSYRLHLKQERNEWVPKKRVLPTEKLNNKRKMIYKGRIELNEASFVAFEKAKKEQNYQVFEEIMLPIVKKYNKIEKPSLLKRALSKGLRLIRG